MKRLLIVTEYGHLIKCDSLDSRVYLQNGDRVVTALIVDDEEV